MFVIFVTQLFAWPLQLFCSHRTSHKVDWIFTDCCPLCLVLLCTHAFSLQNILNVEGLRSCLLENSIANACICAFWYPSSLLLLVIWNVFDVYVSVYRVHIAFCCVRFRCVCVFYLFHTHGLCFCSICLLFLMLNDITSFRFA